MLAPLLDQTSQFDRSYTIIKGVVCLRDMPFGLQLSDHLDHELRPFAIQTPMQLIVQ